MTLADQHTPSRRRSRTLSRRCTMTYQTSWLSRGAMRRSASRSILVLLLGTLVACAADSPTGAKTEEPAAPRAGDGFPPLLRAGIAYSHATHPGSSRYVLYEDSTFVLQGAYEYPGTYSRSDSELTFRFTANAGRWEAKGIVQDDLLFVTYNVEMQWDDFQKGVYRAASRWLTPCNIHLANPDGSDSARRTPGGCPSWSPDGKRIALHRDGEIHVIDAVGSNEVRLVAGRCPTWSPGGRRF